MIVGGLVMTQYQLSISLSARSVIVVFLSDKHKNCVFIDTSASLKMGKEDSVNKLVSLVMTEAFS